MTYRETWSHEHLVLNRDGQQELPTAFCERVSRDKCVKCLRFHQKRKCRFLGDYKYWTLTECADVDLGAGDEVLNRALLYREPPRLRDSTGRYWEARGVGASPHDDAGARVGQAGMG